MADSKVSGLGEATELDGDDLLYSVVDGVSAKVSVDSLASSLVEHEDFVKSSVPRYGEILYAEEGIVRGFVDTGDEVSGRRILKRFDPAWCYENGELGTFSDIRTYATNYFSDAGTTPAVIGDAIYQITDQSGNGANWTQATATARPILQSDSSGEYLAFDLGDDVLNATLAAGTYTVVLPTREGIFFDEVTHAGGTFAVGPTSYTGGPARILTALATGGECRLIGPPMAVNRSLTAAEQAALVQWFRNRGAGPELELGPELVTNGDFSEGTTGWVDGRSNGTLSVVSGALRATSTAGSNVAPSQQITGLTTGGICIARGFIDKATAGNSASLVVAGNPGLSSSAQVLALITSGTQTVYKALNATSESMYIGAVGNVTAAGQYIDIDNVSVRKLQPKGA